MKKHAMLMLLFAGSVMSLAGTALAQPQPDAPAPAPGAANAPAAKRVVLPGDALGIVVHCDPNHPVRVGPPSGGGFGPGGGPPGAPYPPAPNPYRTAQRVAPDGTIALHELGGPLLRVQGLSLKEAADRIVKEVRESGAGYVLSAAVQFVGEHIAEARGAIGLIVDTRLVILDLETARALSDTSAYADALAAKAGLDPNQCKIEGVPILYSGSDVVGRGGPYLSVSVTVQVTGGTQKEARALLRAACEQVAAAFNEWGQKGTEPLRLRYEAGERRAQDLSRALNEGRESMVVSLRGYASLAEYSKAVQSLTAEKGSLLLSMESADVRKRMLEGKIESIRKQMADAAKGDALATELEKVVGLREQAVKQVEEAYKGGRASGLDLGEKQEKLALAKAELLRRREEAARAAGGEQLAQLAQQLTEAELAGAEASLRYKAIEKRLEEMSGKNAVALLEVHQAHLQGLERELLEQEKEVLELRRLAESKPIVAVPAFASEPAPPKEAPATRPAK